MQARVDRVARRHRASAMQFALAWLLARSPSMLVIPGTSRVKHLEENVAAAALELGADDLRELDPERRGA
jgi:aryl-alcohol dehydrogenase-like predicted oxidoreductase